MTTRKPDHWRHLALAALFAGAATFSTSALGDPAVARAEPREWDIGFYDDCMQAANDAWLADEITNSEWYSEKSACCATSGGEYNGYDCVAPVSDQAEEAERQPAPPRPLPPAQPGLLDGGITLYMPPPSGPVAPPPSEAILVP